LSSYVHSCLKLAILVKEGNDENNEQFNWQLCEVFDNVLVYKSTEDFSYRATCIVDCPAKELFDFLLNVNKRNEWDFGLTELRQLPEERVKGATRLYLVYKTFFWPRDIVIVQQGHYDRRNNVYLVMFKSIEDTFATPIKGKVRAEGDGCFIINTCNNHEICSLTYLNNINYMGWIPKNYNLF